MWDFSKLLGSLAGEDSKGFLGGVIDPNARKRTPPKTELTPSENAIQDIASAVRDAQPVNSRNGDFGANSASSLDLVRQATGNDQPITTDASVSSNVTNRPMDYVPASPSDVQQGRVGTQPVVVQPQYSTPPTAQQEMPIAQAPAPTSNPSATQSSGNPLEDLRQQKIDLNAQPIQKQSFWKDFGTNLILGANAFFNPQNGPSPMVGWGVVKRQNENNALDRQIKPLEAIQGQREASNYKQAQSQKLYADTVKQLADANHQRIADDLAGKKWDWHEISGRIFKKYADGKVEPWIDPETGKPGINKTGVPIERLLADGTKVSVTGPQALTADAAMQEANARREQEANLYNDRSQQDVDKWNAENKLKVDLANQKAIADWQSNRFQRAVDIIKSNADAFAKSGEAQGLAEQAQTLAQQAQDLSGRIAEEVDPEEQAKLLKQFNDLTKQMGALQGKFGAVAGEFGKTQELANLYKQSDVQKPKPVGFTPRQFKGGVQPVTRGGKVAQSSDVDAFAQSKGWTRAQAEQYLKNNGYKIQ